MNSLTGAQRPVLKRKILWIAVTAIFLVLAWAKAGFPYPEALANPWFGMGSDGVMHVDGMMPPDYGIGGRQRANADLVLVQKAGRLKTYTYVASNKNGVYSITREGKAWATVTLNKSTGLYELSDPNGTGSPVLKLGNAHNVRPDASTR